MESTKNATAIKVCFINDFTPVMTLEVDGISVQLGYQELKWVELSRPDVTVRIAGEIPTDEMFVSQKDLNLFKEKLAERFHKNTTDRLVDLILQADCTYSLTNITDGTVINIEYEGICLENGWVTDCPLYLSYPLLTCTDGTATLQKSEGKNTKEVVKQYKLFGLFSDLGILNFLEMLLFYPIRGLYYRHLGKPKVLKKNILYYEKHKNDPKKRKKRRHNFLLILPVVLVLAFFWFFLIEPMIFVKQDYPVLVSSDYSTIVFQDDIYEKTDALPDDAAEETVFGIDKWYGARLDGQSRLDQMTSEDKVKLFTDKDGNKYLWLVRDYFDTIHDENGDYKAYADFENPEVYVCRNP